MNNGSTTGTGTLPFTLEDYPTNVFQIADLNGLKWCCFTSSGGLNQQHDINQPGTFSDQNELDPVLCAYTESLATNLLCTWRRRPPTTTVQTAYEQPIPMPDSQKELWLFWYSAEEPKVIEEFKNRNMMTMITHSESTDPDARVEFVYEIRTLFFKALNSSIERRLLTEGFVRFGRWLCRPLKLNPFTSEDRRTIPKFINAIRFHYFLHRDSQICMSIVVQRQRSILRLSHSHLEERNRPQPIILGPWSIRAQLVPGQSALLSQENIEETEAKIRGRDENEQDGSNARNELEKVMERHWIEWKKIYPTLNNQNGHKSFGSHKRTNSGPATTKERETGLPRMVLIELNSQQMFYPTELIGILVDELLPPIKSPTKNRNDNNSGTVFEDDDEEDNSINSPSTSRGISSTRRRDWKSLEMARDSFGDGFIRSVGSITRKEMDDNNGLMAVEQPIKNSMDSMSDLNYNYMRREFCYCRICPSLSRIPTSSQEHNETADKILPSHSSQSISSSDHSGTNFQRHTKFHRIENRPFTKTRLEPRLPSKAVPLQVRNEKTKRTKPRKNVDSIWINGFGTFAGNHQKQQQQQTEISNKEEWDQSNLLCDYYQQNRQSFTMTNSQESSSKNINKVPNYQHQSRLNVDGPKQRLSHLSSFQEDAGPSELERLLVDDEEEVVPQTHLSKENPLGLLQRHFSFGTRNKLRERRKRKWTSQINNEDSASKRKLMWPQIEAMDNLSSAFMNEDNEIFAVDPCSMLPPTLYRGDNRDAQNNVGNRHLQHQQPSLLMKLLLSPSSAATHLFDGQEQQQQQSKEMIEGSPSTMRLTDRPADEYALIDRQMDEYAVTPPALLDTEQQNPDADDEYEMDAHLDDSDEKDRTQSLSQSPLASPASSAATQTQLYQHQQPTPQHHILSPPASNERIDIAGTSTETYSMPNPHSTHQMGGTSLVNTAPSSHDSQCRYPTAAALLHDLSRIYPTPPTPGQQFSPQNMLYHQPVTEQGLLTAVAYFSEQLASLPWEEPLYGAKESQKAHYREFCFKFLSNFGTFSRKQYQHSFPDITNDILSEERVSCFDCLGIKEECEQDPIVVQRSKKQCCERKFDSISSYQSHVGMPISALLHATAQKRTMADTTLETRLQKEEWTRFRLIMDEFGQQNQTLPVYWNQNQAAGMSSFMMASQHQQQHSNLLGEFLPQFMTPNAGLGGPAAALLAPSVGGTPSPQHQISRQGSFNMGNGLNQQQQRNSPSVLSLRSPPSFSTFNDGLLPQNKTGHYQQIQMMALSDMDITTHSQNSLHQIQRRESSSSMITNKIALVGQPKTNISDYLQISLNNKSPIIVLLIQDTIADLHYDIMFDSCPLCCCNSNIRSFELGFYIAGPTKLLARCDQMQQKQRQQHQMAANLNLQWSGFQIPTIELQKCSCGFSAVRHRYLCSQGMGLFPDDVKEAGGIVYEATMPGGKALLHFNPSNNIHCRLVDLLRHLIISRDMNIALINNKNNIPSIHEHSVTDYTHSRIDRVELGGIVNKIFNIFGLTTINETIHPWGYQYADAVGEPRDIECLGIFDEFREMMRDPSFLLVPGRRLEQLTLRTFARSKNGTREEESSRPEPIPYIMALSNIEREVVLLSPNNVRNWEQLELMPIDQPKDVLYFALVPDVNVMAEKCKIYFEELSSIYERRCRLGAHVRLYTKELPRDEGIFRVGRNIQQNLGGINNATSSATFINNLLTQFGINQSEMEPNIQRLIGYVEHCLQELTKFFHSNDAIFERRVYLESAYRQQQHSQATSLASPPDANAMPPPAMPGSNSMFFTSTGPASAAAVATNTNGNLMHNENGPGSASSSVNQNSSPLLIHPQQSPSNGTGPNSVPILHGISENSGQTRVPISVDTGDEQEKQEKFAKNVREQVDLLLAKESPKLPHTVVVYLINPFGQQLGSNAHNPNGSTGKQFEILANAALLCAWNEFLSTVQPRRRSQLQLELISLRSIYDYVAFMGMGQEHMDERERASAWDGLRRTAFAVYTQPRLFHPDVAMGALSKSMTRFGSAERMKEIFQMIGENPLFIRQNCSPYLLAPARSINLLPSSSNYSSNINHQNGNTAQTASNGHKLQLLNPEERVLFLAYCLLPNNDWLCAAVTDERGALLDTTLINIAVTPGSLPPTEANKEWRIKKRHSQIADAIQRLWLFVQSVIFGQDVHQWRLVISRMGKLGHGEFKLWNELLSKKNLRAYNTSLKSVKSTTTEDGLSAMSIQNCSTCANSHGCQETPALLSACLISTEPEAHLRVFNSSIGTVSADGQGGGGGAGGGINANATAFGGMGAIMPGTGAQMGLSGNASKINGGQKGLGKPQQQIQTTPAEDRSLTHIVVFPTILNVSCQQQEDMLHSADDDIDDIFKCIEGTADEMNLVEDLVFDEGARNEEEAIINNQPMAIGFIISTAPIWPWTNPGEDRDTGLAAFWSNNMPASRHRRLAHLKSSLHINSTNLLQSDEYQQQTTATASSSTNTKGPNTAGTSTMLGGTHLTPHPLDMVNTDEVLRYVLEAHNSLSWLSLDPVTSSRCSCLPIHMQTVLRLARSIDTFFGTNTTTGLGADSSTTNNN